MSSNVNEIQKSIQGKIFKMRFNKLLQKLDEPLFKELVIGSCLGEILVEKEDTPEVEEDTSKNLQLNEIDYGKDYVKPLLFLDNPTNMTRIIIGGKNVNIDLNNVEKWTLPELTLQLRNYRNGINNIQRKLNEIKVYPSEETLSNINSIFWNVTIFFDKYQNKNFKSKEAKEAFQLLSIYYGLKHSNNEIKLAPLLIAYSLNSKRLSFYHSIFSKIFKDSFLENYFNKEIPLDFLDDETKKISDNIFEYLTERKIIRNEAGQKAGVALYVARHITNNKEITVKYLQNSIKTEKVSANKINSSYSITFNYFKMNPDKLLQFS